MKFELNYFWFVMIMTGIFLFSLTFTLVQKERVKRQKVRQVEMINEIRKLQSLWALQKGKESISDTAALLLNNQISWAELLKYVSAHIPSSVRLSKISATLSGSRSLVISGRAIHMASLAQVKINLESLKWCKRVALIYLKDSAAVDESFPLSFQMDCFLL
ncbi:MAG: hypothetical protein IIA45_15940 [Bacteroidetes bacterium]|nr:hypothetical protein [Bacteroidota bacterium]